MWLNDTYTAVRATVRIAAFVVVASLDVAISGCGKSPAESDKNDTAEQQQQRKEKAGD